MYDVSLLFLNNAFKFQHSICNGCHDLTMLSKKVNDIAIITIKGVDYCCIIHDIDKAEAIKLFKKSDLKDRRYK